MVTGPSMPWIDPKKEIEADVAAIDNGIKARHQVIRERGGDPRLVDEQIQADLFKKPEKKPEAKPADEQQDETDDSEAVA